MLLWNCTKLQICECLMFICRHIVLVCTQSSANFQYLQVQQGEGCDFSPSLLSYSTFSFLFLFSAGKSAEVIGCLCLDFSGALNARWKIAEHNYKITGTTWFPLSVCSLLWNAAGNGNWNVNAQ